MKVGDLVKLKIIAWARSSAGFIGVIVSFDGHDNYEVVWNDGTRWEDCKQESLEIINESW